MYDMDGTLIQDDSAAKLRELVPGAAEMEMALRAKRDQLGLSIFDENSKRERTRLFKGLPEEDVMRCVEDVLSRMTPGVETMFDAFRPFAKQFVASGGFTHFTKALVERHGLDGQQAIALEVGDEQGKRVLTGEIESGTVDPRAKARWLAQLCAGLPPDSIVLANGDGLNDRDMFRVAQEHDGLAVAYHAYRAGNKDADIDSPDSVVEQAADIKIRHTGQDGVPNFFLPADGMGPGTSR
jgi:phosphoserine phosphatase